MNQWFWFHKSCFICKPFGLYPHLNTKTGQDLGFLKALQPAGNIGAPHWNTTALTEKRTKETQHTQAFAGVIGFCWLWQHSNEAPKARFSEMHLWLRQNNQTPLCSKCTVIFPANTQNLAPCGDVLQILRPHHQRIFILPATSTNLRGMLLCPVRMSEITLQFVLLHLRAVCPVAGWR